MKKNCKLSKILKRTAVVLAVFILLNVAAVPIAYECIFTRRFETEDWRKYEVSDFEGLQMERSDFDSDGALLAGYKYQKEALREPKGVVILCHGYGGGGHNTYMPFIDVFTSNGYYVFSYDARGNDNSEGKGVGGLPQGITDLECAIEHAVTVEEYKALPIVLFGHSWGAYSAANVLNFQPDVEAVALMAGFNRSTDLIYHEGSQVAGPLAKLIIPCFELYETVKFGKELSDSSAVKGFENSDAGVLVAHSSDDETVPTDYGYDKFIKLFGADERFEFVLLENKGHDFLFYSDNALEYRDSINQEYAEYTEENGGKPNGELKSEFMENNLDKKKCFEPDSKLMEQIIGLYDRYCLN